MASLTNPDEGGTWQAQQPVPSQHPTDLYPNSKCSVTRGEEYFIVGQLYSFEACVSGSSVDPGRASTAEMSLGQAAERVRRRSQRAPTNNVPS